MNRESQGKKKRLSTIKIIYVFGQLSDAQSSIISDLAEAACK